MKKIQNAAVCRIYVRYYWVTAYWITKSNCYVCKQFLFKSQIKIITNMTANKTHFTSYLLYGQNDFSARFFRTFFNRKITTCISYWLFLYALKIKRSSYFCCITENLAPSELKKLRNKQRKQRRKAELERQQAAQAQEKREQHNKSRQQNDSDLEQPTLDELIPEKLERVSLNNEMIEECCLLNHFALSFKALALRYFSC